VVLAPVEDGHAWIHDRLCDHAKEVTPEQEALPEWAKRPLVLVTAKEARSVEPAPPVCYDGECGDDQMGIQTGGDEKGVLVTQLRVPDAAPLAPIDLDQPPADAAHPHPPRCAVEGSGESDAQFEECVTYAIADGTWAVQIRGKGEVQENEWPLYSQIDARVVRREGAKWTEGAWAEFARGGTTNLPTPVGRVRFAGGDEVLVLHQQGICCPSESSAWSAHQGSDGAWIRSEPVRGGVGQPCG
jgi:hypothetical protein